MLNWNLSMQEIHNKVRGLSPYPGAFTVLNGKSLKILRGDMLPDVPLSSDYEIREGKFLFRCADGTYAATLIQPEGKKVMSSEEFLRGWRG